MSIPAPSRPLLAKSLAELCTRTPLRHAGDAQTPMTCAHHSAAPGCVRIDDVRRQVVASRASVRTWLRRKAAELIRSESGPTGVEYAVMLTLIATVVMMGISAVGTSASSSFSSAASALNGQLRQGAAGAGKDR